MRFASSLVCTVMPANMSWIACIFGEYALTALCTPRRLETTPRIAFDRPLYARYWLAQSVSAP